MISISMYLCSFSRCLSLLLPPWRNSRGDSAASAAENLGSLLLYWRRTAPVVSSC